MQFSERDVRGTIRELRLEIEMLKKSHDHAVYRMRELRDKRTDNPERNKLRCKFLARLGAEIKTARLQIEMLEAQLSGLEERL